MKNFKKEIIAIFSGIGLAYLWQIFSLIMCCILNSDGDFFITREMFIPSSSMLLILAPTIAWSLMGPLRVRWLKKWLYISLYGLAFLITFIIISAITLHIFPNLWQEPYYWIANIIIAILLAFHLIPSIHSVIERLLPKEDEQS